ncbi:MAG: site-specific integrase, partial [Nitriliruptorales bacterium]|nr:site-specific integrase [Nitriliruptorales bacterium]
MTGSHRSLRVTFTRCCGRRSRTHATGDTSAGTCATSPTRRARRSKQARDKCWTTEQLRTFLEANDGDRLAPAWQIVSTTGLRRSELYGLRWIDVDLERGRLSVRHTITEVAGGLVEQDEGKTDAAERMMALDPRTVESPCRWKVRQTEELMAAFPDVWTGSGLVFTREDASEHRPKRLSSQFTETIDAVGLPRIGIHGLRHSYATAALRAGVSPEVVSKRLGHSSVVVTLSIYAHVFEQDDQAAANRVADAIYG